MKPCFDLQDISQDLKLSEFKDQVYFSSNSNLNSWSFLFFNYKLENLFMKTEKQMNIYLIWLIDKYGIDKYATGVIGTFETIYICIF